LLKKQDVEKIVVVNKEKAEIYIKKTGYRTIRPINNSTKKG